MRGLLYTLAIFGLFFGIAAAEVSRGAKTPSFYVPNGALRTTSPDKSSLMVTFKKRNPGTIYRPTAQKSDSFYLKRKTHFKPVPIDKILQKDAIHCDGCSESELKLVKHNVKEIRQRFKSSIIYALTLKKTDLLNLLKQEFQTINEETKQIIAIKNNFNNASPAYRLANFQLQTQISKEIVPRNKQLKKLKKAFNQILANLPDSEDIYLIGTKDPSFLFLNEIYDTKKVAYLDIVTYVSLFNQKFEHLLTYTRMHEDVLKYSKIYTPTKFFEADITNLFQQLFDDYITDLSRIGRGLDVTNPNLLRMLDDMQDKNLSLELR